MTDGVLTAEARLEQLIAEWRHEASDPRAQYEPGDCSAFVLKTCADELEAILSRWRSAHGSRNELHESRSPDGDGLGVPRMLASERPAPNKPSVAQQHTGHDNREAGSEPADSHTILAHGSEQEGPT